MDIITALLYMYCTVTYSWENWNISDGDNMKLGYIVIYVTWHAMSTVFVMVPWRCDNDTLVAFCDNQPGSPLNSVPCFKSSALFIKLR